MQLLKSTDLGRHSLLYLEEIGHGWFGKVSCDLGVRVGWHRGPLCRPHPAGPLPGELRVHRVHSPFSSGPCVRHWEVSLIGLGAQEVGSSILVLAPPTPRLGRATESLFLPADPQS